MNATLLQRETIDWDTEVDDSEVWTDDLDREAKSRLGYDGLFEERMESRQHGSLRQTLISLDVRPFTNASVEAYKKLCERTANQHFAEVALAGFAISLLVSFIALIVLVFSTLLSFTNVAFYGAIVFLLSTMATIAFGILESRYSRERTWTMKELSSYEEPVPEFALQTAVDIKKGHPDVEFYVCTLEENQIVVDPFLVLRYRDGGQDYDYYLEVWQESNFRSDREV
jgi:hypothetical protein